MAVETSLSKRRFTTAEYFQMAEAGLLPARGVELLRGEIVQERGDGSYQPWRFTGDDCRRMAEIGVLDEDERVELIDGEIIEMSKEGPDHTEVIRRLTTILVLAYAPAGCEVGVQSTHVVNSITYPQPDLVVAPILRGHVRIVDSILVVEVADASLSYDRNQKRRMYAETGAPRYWIVEVKPRQVRMLEDPLGGDYHTETVASEREMVELPKVGTQVPVSSFLPAE